LYPIIGVRSRGSRIWDVDGNEYIDLAMGFGVNLFGHYPSFVIEALEEQLQQGLQIGPQAELAGEVAQLFSEITGMERVAFCNSGTEAVMTAMRLVRTATGRNKIATFEGSYHGHFDGTLGTAQGGLQDPRATPISSGVLPNMVADLLVLEYGNPDSLDVLRAHAHDLAAVLVEPVQSRRPDFRPTEFLHQLRQLTEETGIVLIFDEMITGFRIHPGGAQAWYGIQADMATYGKIVGGGMPVGVVAGKAKYMDAIDGGMWQYGDTSYPQAEMTFFAGTFCKHPLTMAAARAVLNHIKTQGTALQERLNDRTAYFAATLNHYCAEQELPIRIAHFGSLFRFVFQGNLDLLFYHLLEKGVYTWEGPTCFLSTAHTDEDIEHIIRAVQESTEELRKGGFLPQRQAKPPKQIPLNEAQTQLRTLAQMSEEGSLAYNIYTSVRLRGSLRLWAMRQAIQQVVDRHEALRTTIGPEGTAQHISPAFAIGVPLVDLSAYSPEERKAHCTTWLNQETSTPFDLVQGPLFRANMLKLDPQEHLLVLTAHHIIADGWSMSLLLTEIGEEYSALCQGCSTHLEPPLQFSDYLRWQEQQTQTAEMREHETYWLKKFEDSLPVLDLLTDAPRPPVQSYHGRRQTIHLDPDLSRRLKALSREQGCTLFMTLLAACMLVYHRIARQNDLVVGIPVAGRGLEQSDQLVGYCTHLLPIRSTLTGTPTFSEYVQMLKGVLLNGYEHQDYPFAHLMKALEIPRDTSRPPLVSVTFNLDRPASVPTMLDLDVEWYSVPLNFVPFEISLNILEIEEGLTLDCDYNRDVFDADTIDRLLRAFRIFLEHAVANPAQQVAEIPLMSEAERQQVLVEWNQTQTAYPRDACIHGLFAEQATQFPDRIAVICG
ncbi:aminotransferase class III-fold pyridoxal phosphate-dependent enzyme, partial [candidate division KSB3 bacterium]|nr:aminotransferase class III-fold pyridoxal phosphate-dependent enzyme [candidate division KSB3 bacterium]MBD3326370.1 aminotransferase class III-fold pyridoxal phosphate-dependent enzyme [candidate division KSB3 bacterium]